MTFPILMITRKRARWFQLQHLSYKKPGAVGVKANKFYLENRFTSTGKDTERQKKKKEKVIRFW